MATTLASIRSKQAPRAYCRTCGGVQAVVTPEGVYARAKRCPTCALKCTACDGSGYVLYSDPDGQLLYQACECRRLDERVRRFNRANIPARYSGSTLENFDVAPAPGLAAVLQRSLEFVKQWKPNTRGLGLIGEPGCGKTHLMTAVVRELTLRHNVDARFVEFSHLLTELKRGFDEGNSDAGVMLELGQVPLLVIDELGKELSTNWQMAVLDELVSRRYNVGVTTCFTSNYPLRTGDGRGRVERDTVRAVTLEQRIGSRVFSRLIELTDLVTVEAPDFRRARLDRT